MNNQRIAAYHMQLAQTHTNIANEFADGGTIPPQPPGPGPDPGPVTPPAGVPADLHKRILAALTAEYANTPGLTGSPTLDLIRIFGGNATDQPPAAYSLYINEQAISGSAYRFAARLLRAGQDRQTTAGMTGLPADEIEATAATMRGYGLIT